MAESSPSNFPPPRLLPWHSAAVEQLRQAWSSGRLPHALLLHGAEGAGKGSLASWAAAAVLCERSVGAKLDACGACASCALVAAGTHPDLIWTTPEEGKQQISIDQVRAAAERLTRTSYRQGYKIAIIDPAHLMTPGAANSLLKTLEEPAPPSLLILVASRPSSLPATLRSRCQKLHVALPAQDEAVAWLTQMSGRQVEPGVLEFAGGAPLRALAYAGGRFAALDEQMQQSIGELLSGRADVTQVAAQWAKDGLADRLVWLDLWLMSLARGALCRTADRITFPRGSAHLPSLPRALNISNVYSTVDRVRTLRGQLARTALHSELAMESWLFALLDVLAPPAPLQ